MHKIQFLFIGLCLALVGCVKPYEFEAQNFEKVLVVDGVLTDRVGQHEVKVSYTYPLDTTLNQVVAGASVWVEDEDGNQTDYTYHEQGTYVSPAGFAAAEGKSYRLYLELPGGDRYISRPEALVAAPAIDSIYDQYARLPTTLGDRTVGGIQFFIDTHDESGKAKYFRYEWEEGYKIRVPYPKRFVLENDTTLTYLIDSPGICYTENQSSELIYGTTIGSSQNRLAEFPVRFVSEEDQALRVRYSILVRQFAISEAAYLFYKRLRENNDSGGSLFDKQTGSVFGNIYAEENPDQAVLGYFEVSGVSEKRAFFNRSELDDGLDVAGFLYTCSSQNIVTAPLDSAKYYLNYTGGNIFAFEEIPPMPPTVSIHFRSCTDCSFWADPTPPDYWID
ncbi:DUF4249 domain-containing protein [Marinoscillum furvescens]|nr:DUF4249 domain-containing protein [Marinoscillum furvescens]